MNINWKLRLQNKTTLTAIVLCVVACVYQVLGLFGVVPGISEDAIVSLVGIIINLLVGLGIVVDPTTQGITDSEQAMGYDSPKADAEDIETAGE